MHQLRQLKNLLGHAAWTVPFYRERLNALAPLRRGELTLEKWRYIPVLRPADFQGVQAEAASNAVPEGPGVVSENTASGSLGRPVTIKVTGVTGAFFAALKLALPPLARAQFLGDRVRPAAVADEATTRGCEGG